MNFSVEFTSDDIMKLVREFLEKDAYPALPGIIKMARQRHWRVPERFSNAYL
jgi:hypothetical protein